MKSRLPQGYGGDRKDMMKQFQDMQAQIQEKLEEIESASFSATSGGGAVKATVSGKKTVESLQIDPEVIDPDDPDMLQDLVIGAVNEALRKVNDVTESEMNQITGGIPIPGMN